MGLLQYRHSSFLFTFVLAVFLIVLLHLESEIRQLKQERKGPIAIIDRVSSLSELKDDKRINLDFEDLPGDIPLDDPQEELVVIYNRVPKTGSTSFMGIAYDLCKTNKFNVLHLNISKNSHIMSLADQARFVYNVTSWRVKQPAIYHGHVAFIDFSKFGVEKPPVYINIIREPLDRLVSYYYFLRFGDDFRPYVVRKRKGNKVSFDECVDRQERDCDPNNMWLQIPFFCGHAVECWVPGNQWALQEAKRNLIQHYMIVGVTEEIHELVAIMEATLPRFFKGATALYETGSKSHLRKTFNKIKPSQETVSKIQNSKVWKMENDFYRFALQQYYFIKQRTIASIDGVLKEKGKQFFYEKIRPR